MIDAAMQKPSPFNVILVHSFSRFFRDQFQFEFYVRKLAKNGVRLISITQDLGDDPMSVMMRQIMTLFDEYQSKENGKRSEEHTSELQSLMRISYAVFCLKKKNKNNHKHEIRTS